MEERHHLQRTVLGGEGQRLGDAGSGAGQVPLAQGNDLGPRGGARGVQDQSHVVGGRTARCRCALRLPIGGRVERTLHRHRSPPRGPALPARLGSQVERADTAGDRASQCHRQHAGVHLASRGPGGGARTVRPGDERPGAEVIQVEAQLVEAVLGVERCGAAGAGSGQEGDGHLGAVGNDDGDAIGRTQAEAPELACEPVHLGPQLAMSEHRAVGPDDPRSVIGASVKQPSQRPAAGHRPVLFKIPVVGDA